MLVVDVVIVVILVVALIAGLQRGLLASLGTILGLVAGGVAAFWLLPLLAHGCRCPGWGGAAVVAAGVGSSSSGAVIGSAIGAAARSGVDRTPLKGFERFLGGMASVVVAALAIVARRAVDRHVGRARGVDRDLLLACAAGDRLAHPRPGGRPLAELRATVMGDGLPRLGELLQTRCGGGTARRARRSRTAAGGGIRRPHLGDRLLVRHRRDRVGIRHRARPLHHKRPRRRGCGHARSSNCPAQAREKAGSSTSIRSTTSPSSRWTTSAPPLPFAPALEPGGRRGAGLSERRTLHQRQCDGAVGRHGPGAGRLRRERGAARDLRAPGGRAARQSGGPLLTERGRSPVWCSPEVSTPTRAAMR